MHQGRCGAAASLAWLACDALLYITSCLGMSVASGPLSVLDEAVLSLHSRLRLGYHSMLDDAFGVQ
jgi:hypothetical protein